MQCNAKFQLIISHIRSGIWDIGLQAIAHAGAGLVRLLSRLLGLLLQLGDVLLAHRGPVSLDGLLAVGGELRLPVALAVLVLREKVLLVLLLLVAVAVWRRGDRSVYYLGLACGTAMSLGGYCAVEVPLGT